MPDLATRMFSEHEYSAATSSDSLRFAGAVSLISTHLFYLPSLFLCYKNNVLLLTETLLLVVVFSNSYHACLSFESCPANIPVWFARKVDHWTSFVFAASLLLLFVVSNRSSRQSSQRWKRLASLDVSRNPKYLSQQRQLLLQDVVTSDRERTVTRVVHTMLIFVIFVVVFTGSVNSVEVPTSALLMTGLFMLLKILLVGVPEVLTEINGTMFGIGIFFILLGCVFFILPMYILTHNIWHILPAVGVFFAVLAIVYPKWGPSKYARLVARRCGCGTPFDETTELKKIV